MTDRSGKKTRIAVVIPKYGVLGGAEAFAAALTERLALDPRHDCHVFANQWAAASDRVTFHRVPIITFPKFLSTISFAGFAGRRIASGDFDLVHTHERIFSADLCTLHGIPHRYWVRQIRKKRTLSLYDRATDWVERKIATGDSCRLFLPVSSLTGNIFRETYKIDPRRMEIFHPGVDIQPFQAHDSEACRRELRRDLGLSPNEKVILFVSMNFEIKGLDRLLGALAVVRSRSPGAGIKLLVVGKGDERRYRRMAQMLGIGEAVFFAGVLETERLIRTYLACDLYAMLSAFDTFGMVVLEAMAASLPVIVSANVGAKDLVRQGVNGFVIERADRPDEAAGAIAAVLDEEQRRRQMGREAFQTARAHTWEAAAAGMTAIYDRLLSEKACLDKGHQNTA